MKQAYLVCAEVEILVVADDQSAAEAQAEASLNEEVQFNGWTDVIVQLARRRPTGWAQSDIVYGEKGCDLKVSDAMALNKEVTE